MSADRYRILVVDDDEAYRTRLCRAFGRRGFEAVGAASGAEALARAGEARFDRAVVDLRMPGLPGLDLVRALRFLDPQLEIVVVTGYGSIATAIAALKLGAVHYVPKPADVDDILAAFQTPGGAAVATAQVPSLARVEWEHINRVLAACGGNVTKAARLLGMPRRSLQRKLARFPVPR
jgi:two-component system, response regulator RegA